MTLSEITCRARDRYLTGCGGLVTASCSSATSASIVSRSCHGADRLSMFHLTSVVTIEGETSCRGRGPVSGSIG